LLLVRVPDDGERVHDVLRGVAGRGEHLFQLGEVGFRFASGLLPLAGSKIEVEEGGIEFAAEQEAAILVPANTGGRRSRSPRRRAASPRRCRSPASRGPPRCGGRSGGVCSRFSCSTACRSSGGT